MNDAVTQFQQLLRELFQFDCADLDFGIYRIMNYKRAVIERFISEDLPKMIAAELAQGALAEQAQVALAVQAQAAKDLEEARKKVLEAPGDDALDADGNLADKYRETKASKEYLAAQARAKAAKGSQALEAAVYNHLYAFFSRYWQDGDFISKRRYSKKERYAIPYNGEEVTLYWANHDQYYVKTGEYFTDYTWKAPNGATVRFKLQAADVEQNNVKGEKRFFLPLTDEIAWDAETRTLTIPFHFRPLTAQEAFAYGQKNQQESIIANALEVIPKKLSGKEKAEALAALQGEKRRADGSTISLLEHHLRQYTRRNTSDFFIHKDLRGFLQRELDFYLKNEVLNLEEMEAAGEGLAEGWFQLLRLIKKVGGHIIEFLAQIEDFQKMLWEKKKFITETFYVITVANIPEAFYPAIAACEAQWEEWKALGFLENAEAAGAAAGNAAGNAVVSTASTASEVSHKGWHTRGYLPHFDASHVLQFITFRLHDAVPAEVIQLWKAELHWTEQTKPDSKEAIELRKRIERYEDSGYGGCYLRDERIADLVVQALKHFDGERYRLLAWCVMPNHVHVLIAQMPGHLLSMVIHSWKSYTAHEANKLLGRTGDFWMPEYFDRFIRDQKHFNAVVEYIHQNPVKAGLVADAESWPWSSAAGYASVSGANPGNASVADAKTAESGRDVRDPSDSSDPSEPRLAFLKAHPSLPLDTRHFAPDFVDRLLASFENLDEMTDGLLVHSENWQALNLLQEKYRERVKCIYIDPPFNTGSDFLYNDAFRNSTWLTLVVGRLRASLPLFSHDGNYFLHLDYNAVHYGKMVLHGVFPELNELIFNTNATRDEESGLYSYKSFASKYVRQHDTILHAFNNTSGFVKLWKPNRNTSQLRLGQLDVISKPLVPNPKSLNDFSFYVEIYEEGRLVQRQIALSESIFPIGDIWNDIYSFTQSEMRVSENVSFPTQKPENLLRRIIQSSTTQNDLVLDFFAGSGTTASVAHKLKRKYVVVEMGEYFEETYYAYDKGKTEWVEKLGLLGRVKNVLWGDEKFNACGSERRSTLSKQIGWEGGGFVKVIRLESYEDALNNLAFDEGGGQMALQLEDYLLQYMLKWETRKSETLLNVEQLQKPFAYKLHIHRDGETRMQPVDLPETFNYLIGLNVETRRVLPSPNGRGAGGEGRYLAYRGVTREGRRVAVIWRETAGWTEEDYRRDRDFVAAHHLTDGADEIFVNGDSLIPGSRALESVFKARLFAGVEG